MIEKTIKEIKEAEKQAQESLKQVTEEENNKLKGFEKACEKEWDDINSNLSPLKADIIKKHEDEALQELKTIQEEANKKMAILQQFPNFYKCIYKGSAIPGGIADFAAMGDC